MIDIALNGEHSESHPSPLESLMEKMILNFVPLECMCVYIKIYNHCY